MNQRCLQGWLIPCLTLTRDAEGQIYTKAGFVIYAGIDIPGHCNAPHCAHSANTEIPSVKLTVNLWLFLSTG